MHVLLFVHIAISCLSHQIKLTRPFIREQIVSSALKNNQCVLFRLTLADSVCSVSCQLFFFYFVCPFCGGVHPRRGKVSGLRRTLVKICDGFPKAAEAL